ncbi:unnamed protein product [Linum trigynum]|uniref:Uncharacterized protein n=1 Tax=Linum trigynum TaxID=586398 RepID=A0AAV2GB23_9ROSI
MWAEAQVVLAESRWRKSGGLLIDEIGAMLVDKEMDDHPFALIHGHRSEEKTACGHRHRDDRNDYNL